MGPLTGRGASRVAVGPGVFARRVSLPPRGRRVGGGGVERRSAAATLDARRALLADLPSYGARRDPLTRGPPAGRLGWRLAADLELVRTRGIRLFN